MTETKKFIDTAILIYLVEQNPDFFDQVSLFFANSIKEDVSLVTSVLTVAEFSIKPRRLGKLDLLNKFEKTVKSLMDVEIIDWNVAEISSTLRSKYASLKAIDSLQLACAIKSNCQTFVTNDRRLKIVKDIKIQLIKDL